MSNYITSLPTDLPRSRHTILVVEDDFLLRRDVVGEFRRQGFEILEAGNTDQARELLKSEAIDLLFTDITLPDAAEGMDGLGLAKLVRAMRPEMKVIIASGHVQAGDDLKIADACFSKPYDFVRIVAAIRKLLRPASAKWPAFANAKADSMGGDRRL
jgi:DNA-binding response OmpR family regulator